MGQVGGESAHAVSAFISNAIDLDPAGPTVTIIFTANDPTNRLLESRFFPA
jgi:hypothetical protein